MSAQSIYIDDLVGEVSFALLNNYRPHDDIDRAIRFALNSCLMQIVDETNHAAFREDGYFTTVAGTSRYDLAEDYQQIIDESVKMAESPFRTLVFRPEYLHNALERDRDEATGSPTHFFVRHRSATTGLWQMQIWPSPDDAYDMTYRYRALPNQIQGTIRGGNSVLDRRFPSESASVLVAGAASKFKKYLSGVDLQAKMLEYRDGIEKMKAKSIPVAGARFRRAMDTGPSAYGRTAWRGDALTGASE